MIQWIKWNAVHCTALHWISLHYTALHCTALHCSAVHCTALHCTALYCTVLHCTKLHWTALHWNALYIYLTVIDSVILPLKWSGPYSFIMCIDMIDCAFLCSFESHTPWWNYVSTVFSSEIKWSWELEKYLTRVSW